MPRTAARVDANHVEIVDGLRKAGYSVLPLTMGRGAPDILCGSPTRNVLFEIKSGNHKLNQQQIAWHENWAGLVYVVRTLEQALVVMRAKRRR